MCDASLQLALAGHDDVAPGDDVGLHARADDREAALGDDHDRDAEQRDREHRGEHVRAGSLAAMIRQCLPPWARQARTNSRSDHAERRTRARSGRGSACDTIASASVTLQTRAAEERDDGEREDQRWEGEQDVDERADEPADPALEVAGDEPEAPADEEAR